MKVKELKELLNQYPDEMEVMDYNEAGGPYHMGTPYVAELNFVQHHEWNSKPKEWQSYEFPSKYPMYKADIIKTEICLVFGY